MQYGLNRPCNTYLFPYQTTARLISPTAQLVVLGLSGDSGGGWEKCVIRVIVQFIVFSSISSYVFRATLTRLPWKGVLVSTDWTRQV